MRRELIALLSFVMIAGFVFGSLEAQAAPNTTLSLDVAVIGEGDDFSTQVIAEPWNMKSAPYPDFPTTLKDINRSSFKITEGMWELQPTSENPKIWLLWPGINNTQEVLKLGDRFPINTAKYHLLSFRLCSDVESYAFVQWFYGRFIPGGLPPFEASNAIKTYQGCHTYVTDLSQHGGWSGEAMGFRLDPVKNQLSSNLKVDWVRLTTKDTSNTVPMTWSNLPTNTSRLNFYINTSCELHESTLIGFVDNPGSTGTFTWGQSLQDDPAANDAWMYLPLPESIEPGKYSVFAAADDSNTPICSAPVLDIRSAPLINIQKPSMLSGPDYAAETLGDAWGMSNSEDITSVVGFTSVRFENGIFLGIDNSSDPKIFPRMGAPIDTNKYKYASFRFKVNGTQDVNGGWVQRYIWWYRGPTIDPVVTQDLVIYENWQTYSIDLSTAPIESGGGWTGSPTAFRFDPEEIALSTVVNLDYISLTGDEIVKVGQSFPIYYEVDSDYPTTATFYYDTDKTKNNGRTLIGQDTGALNHVTLTDDQYQVFLPLVMKQQYNPYTEFDFLTGDVYSWNTNGVAPGTYYISIDVDDGYNTTTWYSEIPVIVQAQ